MRSTRFWVIVLMMVATVLVLRWRGNVDWVPQSRPLNLFPQTIDGLTAIDIPIDPATLKVLGKGDFLSRQYSSQPPLPDGVAPGAGVTPPIGLFIAYFPTQRSGQSIHSPQNCLPGAGWTFASSGVTVLTDAAGKKYRVGDYIITNGNSTDEALYWYQLHGRSIANDYVAKASTFVDSIRLGRTDEALIRIITPVAPNEQRQAAHARAVKFAERIVPLLPAYIPD